MSIPEAQTPPDDPSWLDYKRKWNRELLNERKYGIYKEVVEYIEDLHGQKSVDCDVALRNQSLPTAAQLGMAAWDPMRDLESIPARIAFLNDLTDQVCGPRFIRSPNTSSSFIGRSPPPGEAVRVSAFTVWNGNMWGLRRSLLPWLQWHTQLGVCRFYVGFQGRDEDTFRALQQIRSLSLILISPPFATEEMNQRWRKFAVGHEWGRRPGNWRLMAKQGFCGDLALEAARREGLQWMMHIDADELIVPSTSLAADLAAAPPWAAALKIHNHEGIIEAFEVHNKYEEVTLFKTHDATLPERAGDLQWRLRLGLHGAYYQVYHNGKSVVRTDKAHVHMWGPHEFLGPRSEMWKDPVSNPEGDFKTEQTHMTLLHVSYASWHDLIGKARTSCPKEYRDAALAGNKTKVKECFCLDFDLNAYMAAARGEKEARDYWVANSLLSEGALQKDGDKCKVFRNVQRLKELMVRDRLLLRVTAPQQVLRAHEVAIRELIKRAGRAGAGGSTGAAGSSTGSHAQAAAAGGAAVQMRRRRSRAA